VRPLLWPAADSSKRATPVRRPQGSGRAFGHGRTLQGAWPCPPTLPGSVSGAFGRSPWTVARRAGAIELPSHLTSGGRECRVGFNHSRHQKTSTHRASAGRGGGALDTPASRRSSPYRQSSSEFGLIRAGLAARTHGRAPGRERGMRWKVTREPTLAPVPTQSLSP
jgi:hypothetical protein